MIPFKGSNWIAHFPHTPHWTSHNKNLTVAFAKITLFLARQLGLLLNNKVLCVFLSCHHLFSATDPSSFYSQFTNPI